LTTPNISAQLDLMERGGKEFGGEMDERTKWNRGRNAEI